MTIRLAVAAVLTVGDEIMVVRRQPHLAAFPGYHAFPGGKVDRDEQEAPFQSSLLDKFEPKQIHALIRELREELDFDLLSAMDAGQVLGVDLLCSVTTPAFHPKRFATSFFKVQLTEKPELRTDEAEIAEASWRSTGVWRQAIQGGELLMAPPLRRILSALADDMDTSTVDDAAFVYDAEREVPCLEALPNFWQLPVRSHTLPPADRTNAFVVDGLLLDPSPKDVAELERLMTTLERFTIRAVFLTHHHADHHQFAETVARRLQVPIWLSVDSHTRILAQRGPEHFEDIAIRHLDEGDEVGVWLGQKLRIYAVPGHDAGQLGLAPEDMRWFVVGDLIQGIGTVVISAPEGDMGAYFQTLERVIALEPKVIFPSHGLGMGTTFRLEETLRHRRKREDQVLALHQDGLSPEAMLKQIYPGLDFRLTPFAMANIQSHMRKLADEDRL